MKPKIPFFLALGITLLFCGLKIVGFLPLERLETLFYDVKFKMRGRITPPEGIVIVAIDDKSVERIGRWPWDRSKLASIVETLSGNGAKVIMLDIILSEPSSNDEVLAKSIKKAKSVILPIVFEFRGELKKVEDDLLFDNAFSFVRKEDKFKVFPPVKAKGVLMPVRSFSESACALGHINMFSDEDGVLRREVLAVEYEGEIYPSIALQVFRVYLDLPKESLILIATEGVQLGKSFIPTDFWGRILIHYYGPHGTFKYISASDVIEGKVKKEDVFGKIVLVGASAAGLYDLRVTPTSAQMPGVEKHAAVIASLIKGDFIFPVPKYVNLLLIFLTGILFSYFISKLKAISGLALALSFVALVLVGNYYFFSFQKIWLDSSYSVSNILIIYLVVLAYRYATEERYAKRIRAIFSSYVTEKLVEELIKNPELVKLGGERREVTVLFSDVMGFTSFSEKHSPEEVVAMLNEYLGEMSEAILSWNGTLDKFVGDEIVAFWGAPLKQENHAELAVRCAIEMVQRLRKLKEKWKRENKPVLDAGIGINSGEVLVGNIGAEGKKMDYTVIGDHVNLGARVEKLTRSYNANILITEFTLEKIKKLIEEGAFSSVEIRRVEKVTVKGREKPVEIYEVRVI